ncbi:MAG TPA: hypothetical protein VFO89_13290 [Thermoanaerobaculia bacterium]|nr:hypothetical protein [Thermoanaerobaculia bacterium]
MSRVERTENPSERRGSDSLRQTERGRRTPPQQRETNPGPTPGKAEGEPSDVEEALQQRND